MRKLLRKRGFVPKLLSTDKLGSRPSQPPSDVKLLRPQLPSDRDCQVDATDDRRGFDTEVPISCRHTMVCRQHHQGVRDRHVVAVAGEINSRQAIPSSRSLRSFLQRAFPKYLPAPESHRDHRLKHGVFKGIVDLQAAINRFLAETNDNPKPFTWTADPDAILRTYAATIWVVSSRFTDVGCCASAIAFPQFASK
jgi:hypothetical protein